MSRKVIVIGAGIGGLGVAAGLRRAGFDVEVYEQAAELKPVGAGIALWANALHALRKLGFEGSLPAYREPMVAGIRTSAGRLLVETESEHLRQKFGEISAVVHRGDLQDALLALYGGPVHLGKALASFEERGDRVVAAFHDGTEVEGDMLIGADGLHSAVRAQLHPGEALRYSGYVAWRGVVPFDIQKTTPGETWGPGRRFGQAPLPGNRVYWFATENTPAGGHAPEGEKAHLLELFRGWHAPIEELIRATPETAILRHDIHDRPPIAHWGRGRVTLLGDAAHPTTPNLGQGGCMALEDAAVLVDCLLAGNETTVSLRNYEERRKPRTSQLVTQAWNIGRVGQWENPLAVGLRNAMVRLAMPLMQDRQMEAVIGYRV